MEFNQINIKYNTEFTNNLLKNKHIFYEIYQACGNRFDNGCGSYLFDGTKYNYCDVMYPKQELLYNSVKNVKNVLEIGTYMGHSILIMLLSNPLLKITCIDISDKYSLKAVNVLNKYFNNAIKFIHSDSLLALKKLNDNYDFFHIDGHHDNEYIKKEFNAIIELKLYSNKIIKIIFDDEESLIELQKNIVSNYKILKQINPKCKWSNVYFEIEL